MYIVKNSFDAVKTLTVTVFLKLTALTINDLHSPTKVTFCHCAPHVLDIMYFYLANNPPHLPPPPPNLYAQRTFLPKVKSAAVRVWKSGEEKKNFAEGWVSVLWMSVKNFAHCWIFFGMLLQLNYILKDTSIIRKFHHTIMYIFLIQSGSKMKIKHGLKRQYGVKCYWMLSMS